MFEPMGGSAPKYTGKNVINPLATICAGGMMMDTLGEPAIAQAIDKAVHDALSWLLHRMPNLRRPASCSASRALYSVHARRKAGRLRTCGHRRLWR
jgi:isocitrate/isopropylmalate dehydrogenase